MNLELKKINAQLYHDGRRTSWHTSRPLPPRHGTVLRKKLGKIYKSEKTSIEP